MFVVVALVVVALTVVRFAVVAKRLVKFPETAVNAFVTSVVKAPMLVVRFARVVDPRVVEPVARMLVALSAEAPIV